MKHILLNGLVVLAGAILISPAFAVTNTYNGSVCKLDTHNLSSRIPLYTDYPVEYTGYPRYSIKNNYDDYVFVACPVNDANVLGSSTKLVRVYFIAWSGVQQTVGCWMNVLNDDGTKAASQGSTVKLQGAASGYLTIPSVGSKTAWSSYLLECMLPPQGEITWIYVDE